MLKLKSDTIKIHEPFAEYLGNTPEIIDFEISLLDVAKLSGHLCPSVAGAFLLTRKAVELLYPDTKVCIRGQMEVHLPGAPDEGPLGPMANVISYITGAWSETGFGGLGGTRYLRKDLLHFASPLCKKREFVFIRLDNKKTASVFFNPKPILQKLTNSEKTFQESWQANVEAILNSSDAIESF
ncbi:MAG TPA: hypothetical protein VIG33_06425 [Pseudobdellovibrionaceae bacterium]|jgi:hypothetical protein